MRQFNAPVLLAGVLLVMACSGGETPPRESEAPAAATPSAPAAPAVTGAPDAQLAAQGEQLFQTRGCNACHTIGGGRLVGPDLAGISTRREPAWILAMILNPDSMIRGDSIARRLFAEYMTPMANQNLSQADARALLEFLRTRTGE